MQEMRIFENAEFGQVRTAEIKAFDSRLNVKNWLIERETTEEMRLIHRISGKEKVILK